MKKFTVILILISMLAFTASCSRGEANGVLNSEFMSNEYIKHRIKAHPDDMGGKPDNVIFDNLSSMLLALESGEIKTATISGTTAEYITANNDRLIILDDATMIETTSANYSMMTTTDNTELFEKLNGAIAALKADGTLDKLIEDSLKAYIESDPTAAALPQIDGAPTVKVAVTGDIPPMDFVTADGKPAGFNIALLSAISEYAEINFVPVIMNSGARLTALASGNVDALFWTNAAYCAEHEFSSSLVIPDTLITEPYFTDTMERIALAE